MTKELLEELTFSVPLGLETHRLAQQFCQQQSNQKKAKQVYLNTLAVSAVKFYLNCMGIDTNLSASSSWNLVMQTLMDIADLEIPNIGKLECRPVLPEMQTVYIPPESSERIGYVAVQFDQLLQTATLLGFTQTVPESGELPITQLQSLESLLKHLRQIRYPEAIETQICLSQWFEDIFAAGWQSLEAFLASQQQFALRLRSLSQASETTIKGAKIIDLGLQLEHHFLILLIAIAPEPDGKVGILVQVHPTGTENYLPPGIELSLLSESKMLQLVRSRPQDNYIQLKRFRGTPGECFNIRVASTHASVTENFVI